MMREMSTFEDFGSLGVVSEIRSAASTLPLSHVQLACNHQYSAFPLNGNNLCIWNNATLQEQPLVLKGHHEPITAVALKHDGRQCLACSASQDYVIIWNIHECSQAAHQGLLPRGQVIGTLLGTVQHLGIHPNKQLVAACASATVFILNTEREEILTELIEHLGPVTAAEFWSDDLLVCISEDRSFSIWNYYSQHLIYRSGIISAFPLLKMYIDAENKQLITGCADGMLKIFSLAKEHNFRSICHINLQKEKYKFCNIIQKAAQNGKTDTKTFGKDKSSDDLVDSDLPILHLQKCAQLNQEYDMPLCGNSLHLWVGSSTGLLLVNISNAEVEGVLHFEDYDNLSIHLAGSVSISSSYGEKNICLIASMFGCKISLMTFDTHAFSQLQKRGLQHFGSETNLSIVSSDPLLLTSPLRCELPKKQDKLKTNGPQTKIKDQPLVFHSKIKSSGYTTAPRMKMFSPKTNIKAIQVSKVKKEISRKEYPLDIQVPSNLHKQIRLSSKSTSACGVQYSGDAVKLACGLADKSLLVFNSTFIGEPAIFTGHDGAINGFGWSYDRNWLVSTADDRTLRIWNVKNASSALVLGKETFSRPPLFPQFYYMDKFILLSSGAEIQLMRYYLDNCKDEIKRYKQNNVCKPVQTLHMESAMEVTGLSAVNDFYSYIVLAAGSNRDVEIFDLNVGTRIASIPDVHSRAAHQICQNKGSAFSTQPADAYNLFVTMAIGDCLKLWDIRNLRCVRRFEGHLNRYQTCGVAVSPCGRFIACGSEDRCAYIYETRSSTYLQKLPEHSESVINVAFNPAIPQLTTCTLDGKLQTYVP
ncbi:WD repeat-containing protein 27 [Leptodactylus fuscus]